MNLGGLVIPIQFMTSDWSYFEFSHQTSCQVEKGPELPDTYAIQQYPTPDYVWNL